MTIEPMKTYLLLAPLTDVEGQMETASGIIIPDAFKEKNESRIYKVDKVGPDVENKNLKPDTQVLLSTGSLLMKDEFDDGTGAIKLMVQENAIIAIIKQ